MEQTKYSLAQYKRLQKNHNNAYSRIAFHGYKHKLKDEQVEIWWLLGCLKLFEDGKKLGRTLEQIWEEGVRMPEPGLDDLTKKPHLPLRYICVVCSNKEDFERQIEKAYLLLLKQASHEDEKKQVIQRCCTAGIIWSRAQSKGTRELHRRIKKLQGMFLSWIYVVHKFFRRRECSPEGKEFGTDRREHASYWCVDLCSFLLLWDTLTSSLSHFICSWEYGAERERDVKVTGTSLLVLFEIVF